MFISDKKLKRIIRSIILESKPTRSRVEDNVKSGREEPIRVDSLGEVTPLGDDLERGMMGGMIINDFITKSTRYKMEYIRIEFDVNNYIGQLIIDLREIVKYQKKNMSRNIDYLAKNISEDEKLSRKKKFVSKVMNIAANVIDDYFVWFYPWTKNYDRKINDSERIRSMIDKYRYKYQEAFNTNIKEDFDNAYHGMKNDIKIVLTITPDPGTWGTYYSGEEHDEMIVKHYTDGTFAEDTAVHEFQHRHDWHFGKLNKRLAKVSGMDVKDTVSYKSLAGPGQNKDITLSYTAYQYDQAVSSGNKDEIEDVLKSHKRGSFNLPDLDYVSLEEYLKNNKNNNEDEYYFLFYDLKSDHLPEFVQQIGYLSDELGYDKVDTRFLTDYLTGKIDYSKLSAEYRDLKEVAEILKNTQKNKIFFRRYANTVVKRGTKSSSAIT